MLDPVTQHHVEQAAKRLARRVRRACSRSETIERYIGESLDLLGELADQRLRAGARASFRARAAARRSPRRKELVAKEQPEVLFVCVHNAGRSQMAAGLVKLRSDGRIHVRSAGSAPGERDQPGRVEAMNELGVDMSEEFPKPLTDEVVRAADVVITMGCGDACPIYPGKRYEDWELDDPAGQDVETVRRIRDEIDARVQRSSPSCSRLDRSSLDGAPPKRSRTSRSSSPDAARSSSTREHGGSLGAVGVGLVFGLVIMAMVYATGHLSGAHINPA